jgi:alkylhydroperoxidase/carboxymuconolactone decarboxylase family protein YurZ
MTTLEERFQKGIETLTKFRGGTPPASTSGTWREMAPDLYRIVNESLFGTIWHRPALEVKQREMSTLSVLTVLERHTQLRGHTGNALNLGLTPEQIVEIFIHLALYGGAPVALNAFAVASEVFRERGVSFTPQQVYDPQDDPETLYQRGVEKRRELMGDRPPGPGTGPVTNAEGDLNRLTTEYVWGSVWTRPGLDIKSRSICTISALTALGRERQLRSHIRGALRIGFTQEEIVEIFVHTVFYAGLPAARTGIDIANEVFQSG